MTIGTFLPDRIRFDATDDERQFVLGHDGILINVFLLINLDVDVVQCLAADGVVKGGIFHIGDIIPSNTSGQASAQLKGTIFHRSNMQIQGRECLDLRLIVIREDCIMIDTGCVVFFLMTVDVPYIRRIQHTNSSRHVFFRNHIQDTDAVAAA